MNRITLTTAQLRRLCEEAESLQFANGPNERFWKAVDPDGRHVVDLWMEHRPFLASWEGIDHGFNFEHNGGLNIRAMVVARMKRNRSGQDRTVYLKCDFDHDSFMAIIHEGSTAQRGRGRATARRAVSRQAAGRKEQNHATP